MATTRPSVAVLVRRQIEAYYPYAACDDCLAHFVLAPISEVRDAALLLAKEAGFVRRLRVCYTCRSSVELTAQE